LVLGANHGALQILRHNFERHPAKAAHSLVDPHLLERLPLARPNKEV
jgi:hypothetical protein